MHINKRFKIFGGVFALLCLFGLTACSGNQNNQGAANALIAYQNKVRTTEVFQGLTNVIYDMGWSEETMVSNQKLYANNPQLEKRDGYNGIQALTNMIKTVSNAGQVISKPLFCKLLKLDMQADSILNNDGTINTNKLITIRDYWATKKEILPMLWKEQASFNSNVDDAMARKYSRSDCPDVPLPENY